jgi:hypothetical protein
LFTKCPTRVFYIWLDYRQIISSKEGLETTTTPNDDFVQVCSTCNVVELNTLFETWISRNVVNAVNLFLFPYSLTLSTYLCSQWAPNVQMNYFMFNWSVCRLLVLNRCWKPISHQMMIFVCYFDMQRSWTKNELWAVNNMKCRKWCKFFSPFNLIILTTYLCLQWAPNIHFMYFIFDWSIYRLLVLNRG